MNSKRSAGVALALLLGAPGPAIGQQSFSGPGVNTGDYSAGTNLYSGQPEPLVNLNEIFSGRSLAGTWTLTIEDDGSGDTESLSEWSIVSILVPGPAALALGAIGVVGVGRRQRS